ncbi:MAG: hypothetical protein JWQ09_5756 [Segetibacter sp.]|nr:hypothetical protein [Segetibacter sp.]
MKQLFIYTILFTVFLSCKKEINVDLPGTSSQVVIEASVTNATYAEVNISKSVRFSNSNSFPKISGAVVSITDDKGGNYKLTETKPGTYTSNSLFGVPGRTYNLTIKAEGKEYTATSGMPLLVNLDTLLVEKIYFGGKSVWIVKPQYIDPAGFGDSYLFFETINGKRYPNFWAWDDKFANNTVSTTSLIQTDSTIKINDIIEVEMRCIDMNMLRYYTALQDSQNNVTTPANPENKITGGALGYFSAHTTQKKKVKVQ